MDSRGRPTEITATAGQEHDIRQAARLLADHEPRYVIADKAYDSDAFIGQIECRGSTAVIPLRAGRTVERRLLRGEYRKRNQVERFVNRIKHQQRIATRYEKTARNFPAFVHLGGVLCWV